MQWIDYMFTHRPVFWGPQNANNNTNTTEGRPTLGALRTPLTPEQYDAMVEARAKARGVDPYALIKEEN
jgi:hypothetical protein